MVFGKPFADVYIDDLGERDDKMVDEMVDDER